MNIIRVLLVSSFLLIAIGLSAQTEANSKSEFSVSVSFESGVDSELFVFGSSLGFDYITPSKFSFGIGLGYISKTIYHETSGDMTSSTCRNKTSNTIKTMRILGGRSLKLNRRGNIRLHLQSGVGLSETIVENNFRRVSNLGYLFGPAYVCKSDEQIMHSLTFEVGPKLQFFMNRSLSLFIVGRGQFIPDLKPVFSLGIGMDIGRFVFKK